MTRTILPQELVDLIIDEVANENRSTRRLEALRACSVTSWSFLTPARKHIFTVVDLEEDSDEDNPHSQKVRARLECFTNLLQSDPCKTYSGQPLLSQHVRTLNIRLWCRRQKSYRENPQDAETRHHFVDEILQSLFKVENITLSLPGTIFSDQWLRVHEATKEAIEVFCTSRPILNLRLSNMESFPVAILTRSHLKTFSMDNCRMFDWNIPLRTATIAVSPHAPSTTPKPPFPPTLERLLLTGQFLFNILSADHNASMAQLVNVALQLQSLRALTLDRIDNDSEWTVVKALPSLTRLCVKFLQRERQADWPKLVRTEWIDYGQLARLETLELCCDFGEKAMDAGFIPLQRWRFFNHELEGSMNPSSIKTLIIRGKWKRLTRKKEGRNFWPRSGWKNLDTVLSNRVRFPNLSSLQFNLCLQYDRDWTVTWEVTHTMAKEFHQLVQEKLKRLLPTIYRSPLVQVSIDIDVIGSD